MLGDDVNQAGKQSIEDWQDAAGGGVLYGHDQKIHLLVTERLERCHERRESDPIALRKEFGGGLV
jgi:hypothetical protein